MKPAAALVALAAIAALASACETSETGTAKNSPQAKPSTGVTKPEPAKVEGPVSINAAKPVRWGNWELVGKVNVEPDLYSQWSGDFEVKNLKDEPDTGYFDVVFLKGTKVLGTMGCTTAIAMNTPKVKPDEVAYVTCDADNDDTSEFKRGWTDITVDDTYH